jgi:hypothetical protein
LWLPPFHCQFGSGHTQWPHELFFPPSLAPRRLMQANLPAGLIAAGVYPFVSCARIHFPLWS